MLRPAPGPASLSLTCSLSTSPAEGCRPLPELTRRGGAGKPGPPAGRGTSRKAGPRHIPFPVRSFPRLETCDLQRAEHPDHRKGQTVTHSGWQMHSGSACSSPRGSGTLGGLAPGRKPSFADKPDLGSWHPWAVADPERELPEEKSHRRKGARGAAAGAAGRGMNEGAQRPTGR